jgi:methionine salvage enolase-phosphatase E1
MSADEVRTEQRSSVKIAENSKGEPAVEVKVYSHDRDDLDATREAAVELYRLTRAAVRP